jgi:hypothetical protein
MMSVTFRNSGWSLLLLLIFACANMEKKEEAKIAADELFDRIAAGTAEEFFAEKYFPKAQTKAILGDLKEKCDFVNRKGKFIKDYYHKKITESDRISLIYEYSLKCDSIRFILTYNLSPKLELYEFKMEPVEKIMP